MAFGAESVLPMKLSKHGGSYMNLLNLLILALACLIGMLIIKRALERTKNDRDPNDEPRRNRKTDGRNSRGVRTKVMIERLRGT